MAKTKKTTLNNKEVKKEEVMGAVKVAASKKNVGLALTLKRKGNNEWITCKVFTVYLSIDKGMKGKCAIQAVLVLCFFYCLRHASFELASMSIIVFLLQFQQYQFYNLFFQRRKAQKVATF